MSDRLIYKFPSAEEILNRLVAVERPGSDVGRIYRLFAAKVADSEKVPHGVNLAWQMAIVEVAQLPGAPPSFFFAALDLRFGDWMTALFPDDPAFAAAVIEVRAELLKAMRNDQ